MSDPISHIQKLVTKYPYLEEELNSLQTMFTVREDRLKEHLKESEEKVYDLSYQLSCEKLKAENQAVQLADEKKKSEAAEIQAIKFAREKETREAADKNLAAEKKALGNSLNSLRVTMYKKEKLALEKEKQQLGMIARLERRANVLEEKFQFTDKMANAARKEVNDLTNINNRLRPQVLDLTKEVKDLEAAKKSLAEKCDQMARTDEGRRSVLQSMLKEWDQPASIIPMKRSRDSTDSCHQNTPLTTDWKPNLKAKASETFKQQAECSPGNSSNGTFSAEPKVANAATVIVESDSEDDMPLAKRSAATREKSYRGERASSNS